MEKYKQFHLESSLSLENAEQFSSIASWVSQMRDFSRELLFTIPKYWKKSYSLKNYNRDTVLPIETLLSIRKSSRVYTPLSICIDDLSFILNHSLGISRMDEEGVYFTYPSSGGIQSIVPIIFVTNVEGVEQGIYYYDAKQFDLYRISDFESIDYTQVTSSTEIAYQSAFSIHLFAMGNQKCYKYQDRGYRFLLLECGHIMQNIHLCSTALGVGCVMSGGGYDSPTLKPLSDMIRENDMMVLYECFLGSI